MELFLWSTVVFCGTLVGLGSLLQIAAKFLIDPGPFTVDINGGERVLQTEGGSTLLAALTDNKIFIPSACGGQATCGHCKARVLDSQESDVLATEKSFLTRQELRNGTRLACQVKVKRDMNLRIPEHLLAVKQYEAQVASIVDVTYDIKEIRLKLVEPASMDYSFGHYIQVNVPDPDEGYISRAYSISSPIKEKSELELNVRLHPAHGKIPAGKGSSYLHSLTVGEEVTITGPYGEFELDEDPNAHLICVGGGAGMAPMKNLILSILDTIPGKPVWLFFGCRGTADIFYLDMYEELAEKHPQFNVVYALSDMKEGEQWDGKTGFIHLSVDECLSDDLRPHQAFLCGPPLMIEAVTEVLLDKNMKPERIFYDKY
ncbi:MAG: FAD-binding oxidoreductase [Planctomycetota bacterium]